MNWLQLHLAKKELRRQAVLDTLALKNIQAVCQHEWIIVGQDYYNKGYLCKDVYCPVCQKLEEGVSQTNASMMLDISAANMKRRVTT